MYHYPNIKCNIIYNNTSEYNDKYMATISNVENGKVLL